MRLRAVVFSIFLALGAAGFVAPEQSHASRSAAQAYFDARVKFEQNKRQLQRAIKHLFHTMGLHWRGRPMFSFDGSRDVTAFFKLKDGRGCEVMGELDQDGVAETTQPICSIR